MLAECTSRITHTDIISGCYQIRIGGINPCVYKAAAEGRGVGGAGLGHCPAATHMVLLLAITGSPEHLPGGWFYNPYVLDEERRLVS